MECPEEFNVIQSREVDQFAAIWIRALKLPGQHDFVVGTLHEIGRWRGISDLTIVRGRCENALRSLKLRWERTVQKVDAPYVEKYYDAADEYIEELMWWRIHSRTTFHRSPMLSPWNLLRRSVVKPASISALASVPAHCSSAVIASTLPLADISRIMLSFCK